ISFELMKFVGPAKIEVRSCQQDAARWHVIVGQVAVAGKNGRWVARFDVGPNEKTEIVVSEPGETVRGRPGVAWAIEDPGRHQVIGKRLKEPEQEVKLTAQARGGLYELERAACIGGNLGGKMVVMVVGEHLEPQADLFQIADTLDPARTGFG